MLYALRKKQKDKCVCCGKGIGTWHKLIVHRITARLKGGDYNMSNLCIMHDLCHKSGFNKGFVYKLPVISNRSS
jgi:hypothetical protein